MFDITAKAEEPSLGTNIKKLKLLKQIKCILHTNDLVTGCPAR